METKSDNEIIAEFMELDWKNTPFEWRIGAYRSMDLDDLNYYQTSWGWIMPVVERIKNKFANTELRTFKIYSGEFRAHLTYVDKYTVAQGEGSTMIESVYKACLEYIKWYNQQPK